MALDRQVLKLLMGDGCTVNKSVAYTEVEVPTSNAGSATRSAGKEKVTGTYMYTTMDKGRTHHGMVQERATDYEAITGEAVHMQSAK